jgi:hypothetical protein
MNLDIVAAFLCGAICMELAMFGVVIYEQYQVLERLRQVEERQAAGEWLPPDQC